MKIKDKYEEIKSLHQDEVVLFKVGSFYITFSKDAIVLNYLFSYQVNNGKLGFPISAFEKVCANLKEKNISFYIFEEEDKNYRSDDNLYNDIAKIAERSYYSKCSNELLLERIKNLITTNKDNYNKIKEFVDEL